MATTPEAKVRITAKDETAQAFASAGKRMEEIGKRAPDLISKLAGIGTAITAGLAALQSVTLINTLDQLDDLSEKTGVNVRTLSELRFAGEVTGTSFESLATGVGQLAKRLDDAARGGKENGELFKRLGVSIKDADGKMREAEDVLVDVADVFKQMPDGVEKAALAQKLFGKSGLDLIPILNQGGEGLRALRKEASDLGVVYSEDLAKAAATFNDNLRRTTLLAEGLAVQLAGPLLDGWNRLFDSMLANTRQMGVFRGLLETLGGAAAQRLGLDEMGQTKSKLAGITAEIDRVSNVLAGLENVLQREPGNEAAQRRYDKLRDTLRQLRTQSVETTSELSAQAAVLAKDLVLDPRDALAKRLPSTPGARVTSGGGGSSGGGRTAAKPATLLIGPEVPESTQRALERLQGVDSAKLRDLNQQLQELLSIRATTGAGAVDEAILKLEEEIQQLQGVPDDVLRRQERLNELLAATPTAELERTRATMLLLAEAFERGEISAAQFGEAATGALGNTPPKVKEAVESIDEFSKQAARNIQDALGDTLSDSLSGNWDNIAQRWQRLIIDMTAQALAADLSSKLLGDYGKTGKLGGWFGDFVSGGSSLITSILGPGRARGGPVYPGMLHEVTERGQPELFSDGMRQWLMSPTGGQVTPLAASGAGATNNVFNVAAGITRNELVAALQTLSASIEGRIDARMRMRGSA